MMQWSRSASSAAGALALLLASCVEPIFSDAHDAPPTIDGSAPIVANAGPRHEGLDASSTAQEDAASQLVLDAGLVDAGPVDAGPVDAGPVDAEASAPTSPLRAECALLLHMDEPQWSGTPGEVRDDSGHANHGRAQGTARSGDGRYLRAGQFDGAGWLSVPDSSSLHASEALTVSAWFYLDELPGTRYPGIIAKRTAYAVDTTFAVFLSPDNKLNVDVDGEESRFTSVGSVGAGRWTHVAVVFDGDLDPSARVALYLDGKLDRTAFEPSSGLPAYRAEVLIGNLVNGGDTFVGRIDEVGLWTRALSALEIAALADATSGLF